MQYTVETLLQQIPEVSCVEGDETNLYVGTKDGQLLHYVIHRDDPDSDSSDFTYLLASRQDAASGQTPMSIILLTSVQLAAVHANNTLSFYSLPEFAPASELRIIKDVRGVLQNCNLDDRNDIDGSAFLTVFTKKKIRQIKVTRTVIKLSKEVEYAGCLAACQRGPIVCAATKSTYDLIDLDQKARIPLFPVVQGEADPVGPQYDSFLPRILSVTPNEFLLASGSPESTTTMGMFITSEGEITRGTLMFSAYPLKLILQFPYVIALLDNETIEVHEIESQNLEQTISAVDIEDVCQTGSIVPVVSNQHLNLIKKEINQETAESPETYEKTPTADLNVARNISDVHTDLLTRHSFGVGALITQSPFVLIDMVLNDGDVQRALDEAEILARDTRPDHAERLFNELAYIYQKAGLIYFKKMLFDDAIKSFKKGDIDPRILISFFPEFAVHTDQVIVYSGLRQTLKSCKTVDEIIRQSLSETVEDPASLAELEIIVRSNAIELLRRYLTTFREKREYASISLTESNHELFSVVDRILLLILLATEALDSSEELQAFLQSNVEDPENIAEILTQHKKWLPLLQLSSRLGKHRIVLQILKELHSGVIEDPNYSGDAVSQMRDYLLENADEQTTWEYGLWLTRNSSIDGIQLLLHVIGAALVTFSIHDVAEALKKEPADRETYIAFLDYLVVDQGIDSFDFTNELVSEYGHRMVASLADQAVSESITGSINDYRALSVPKVSYLAFVSSLSGDDRSDVVANFLSLRAKFINILQTSEAYEPHSILETVLQQKTILLAERILLYGRLSRHADSLNLMVHDLKDFDSAEAYCYNGGVSLSKIRMSSDKKETVLMRRQLFPLLFAEYLKLEDYSLQFNKGSALLNRWSNYMDVTIVLNLVPDHWTVEMISAFLISALSKLAGEKRDAQVRRSLARTQLQRQKHKKYIVLA